MYVCCSGSTIPFALQAKDIFLINQTRRVSVPGASQPPARLSPRRVSAPGASLLPARLSSRRVSAPGASQRFGLQTQSSRGQIVPHRGFCWGEACKIPRSGFGIVAKNDYPHHIPRSGLRKMNI